MCVPKKIKYDSCEFTINALKFLYTFQMNKLHQVLKLRVKNCTMIQAKKKELKWNEIYRHSYKLVSKEHTYKQAHIENINTRKNC
jgi:hypothetical protein